MESSSVVKRQKVMDVHNMRESHDHLSELPDSILFYILSFLSTEHAVQMSILSRRWRYLWTSMPTLDFDYDLFQLHNGMDSSLDKKFRFVDFVNKVLLLHGMRHIQRFRLASFHGCDFFYVNMWINVAIKKNVKELNLGILEYATKLPRCLFTCESLVSLKLKLCSAPLKLPTSICFPKLKSLHLESIIFLEDSFLKLLSSCPILENFMVVRCQWGDHKVVGIPLPKVRDLCMSDCVAPFSNLKISIPNLITFKYRDCHTKDYFENLSSLIDALIDIPIDSSYCRSRYEESFSHVSKLLGGVSNARSLTLSDTTLEQLSNAPNLLESLPTFDNLNKLILTSGGQRKHFVVIAYLLQSSPVLESLVIDIKPSSIIRKYALKKGEAGQVSKKLCLEGLLDHLKVVKIGCFQGSGNELQFVKLLLNHANTMERVIIIEEEGDLDKRMKTRKKLWMFQKAAADCIISFS